MEERQCGGSGGAALHQSSTPSHASACLRLPSTRTCVVPRPSPNHVQERYQTAEQQPAIDNNQLTRNL